MKLLYLGFTLLMVLVLSIGVFAQQQVYEPHKIVAGSYAETIAVPELIHTQTLDIESPAEHLIINGWMNITTTTSPIVIDDADKPTLPHGHDAYEYMIGYIGSVTGTLTYHRTHEGTLEYTGILDYSVWHIKRNQPTQRIQQSHQQSVTVIVAIMEGKPLIQLVDNFNIRPYLDFTALQNPQRNIWSSPTLTVIHGQLEQQIDGNRAMMQGNVTATFASTIQKETREYSISGLLQEQCYLLYQGAVTVEHNDTYSSHQVEVDLHYTGWRIDELIDLPFSGSDYGFDKFVIDITYKDREYTIIDQQFSFVENGKVITLSGVLTMRLYHGLSPEYLTSHYVDYDSSPTNKALGGVTASTTLQLEQATINPFSNFVCELIDVNHQGGEYELQVVDVNNEQVLFVDSTYEQIGNRHIWRIQGWPNGIGTQRQLDTLLQQEYPIIQCRFTRNGVEIAQAVRQHVSWCVVIQGSGQGHVFSSHRTKYSGISPKQLLDIATFVFERGYDVIDPFASFPHRFTHIVDLYTINDSSWTSLWNIANQAEERVLRRDLRKGCPVLKYPTIYVDQERYQDRYTQDRLSGFSLRHSIDFVTVPKGLLENNRVQQVITRISVHEKGHSFGKLDDEYVYADVYPNPTFTFPRHQGVNCYKNPNDFFALGFSASYGGCTDPVSFRSSFNSIMRTVSTQNFNVLSCAHLLGRTIQANVNDPDTLDLLIRRAKRLHCIGFNTTYRDQCSADGFDGQSECIYAMGWDRACRSAIQCIDNSCVINPGYTVSGRSIGYCDMFGEFREEPMYECRTNQPLDCIFTKGWQYACADAVSCSHTFRPNQCAIDDSIIVIDGQKGRCNTPGAIGFWRAI